MIKHFYLTKARAQTGTTAPGQSGPRGYGTEGVFLILQSSKTETSSSDSLVSHPVHLLSGVGGFFSAEMHSAYSTTPADWVVQIQCFLSHVLVAEPSLRKQSVLFIHGFEK